MTLNASTGLLSGTPTAAGTYSFTVKVTDASGLSDSEPVTVTIIPGPSMSFAAPPAAWTNTVYGYTLTGTFGDPEHGPTFRYGGGYIATIKPRDSATFLSMSRQAGANVDYGTGVLGGRLTWGPASIASDGCTGLLNIVTSLKPTARS